MKKRELVNLAKVFVKYDFFNDERDFNDDKASTDYSVLSDVYSSLPVDVKDYLCDFYHLNKRG